MVMSQFPTLRKARRATGRSQRMPASALRSIKVSSSSYAEFARLWRTLSLGFWPAYWNPLMLLTARVEACTEPPAARRVESDAAGWRVARRLPVTRPGRLSTCRATRGSTCMPGRVRPWLVLWHAISVTYSGQAAWVSTWRRTQRVALSSAICSRPRPRRQRRS
jgi:hypothetical protein